jgi:hypothetical protein
VRVWEQVVARLAAIGRMCPLRVDMDAAAAPAARAACHTQHVRTHPHHPALACAPRLDDLLPGFPRTCTPPIWQLQLHSRTTGMPSEARSARQAELESEHHANREPPRVRPRTCARRCVCARAPSASPMSIATRRAHILK